MADFAKAQSIIDATGVEIRHGGKEAFYSRSSNWPAERNYKFGEAVAEIGSRLLLSRFDIPFTKRRVNKLAFPSAERIVRFIMAFEDPSSPLFSNICSCADFIQVPERRDFIDLAGYYLVVFHELIHWAESRIGLLPTRMDDWVGARVQLKRDLTTKGGTKFFKGSAMNVTSYHRGKLVLAGDAGSISRIHKSYVEKLP